MFNKKSFFHKLVVSSFKKKELSFNMNGWSASFHRPAMHNLLKFLSSLVKKVSEWLI